MVGRVPTADLGHHWDRRYGDGGAESVSWYQEHATVSGELIGALGPPLDAAIVDIGGGASTLVDDLVGHGHTDVSVVDISSVALDAARGRLGDPPGVTWIHVDVLSWRPTRRWDVWHDRAVLHFLVDDDARATYLSLMRRALTPGGGFVIGTFASDGPSHCSGLPVRRYSDDDLMDLLGPAEMVEHRREVHHTPGGAAQPFTWISGRRTDS